MAEWPYPLNHAPQAYRDTEWSLLRVGAEWCVPQQSIDTVNKSRARKGTSLPPLAEPELIGLAFLWRHYRRLIAAAVERPKGTIGTSDCARAVRETVEKAQQESRRLWLDLRGLARDEQEAGRSGLFASLLSQQAMLHDATMDRLGQLVGDYDDPVRLMAEFAGALAYGSARGVVDVAFDVAETGATKVAAACGAQAGLQRDPDDLRRTVHQAMKGGRGARCRLLTRAILNAPDYELESLLEERLREDPERVAIDLLRVF